MLKAEVEVTLVTRHAHHFLLLAASFGTFIGENLKDRCSVNLFADRQQSQTHQGGWEPFSFSERGPICSPCRCARPL